MHMELYESVPMAMFMGYVYSISYLTHIGEVVFIKMPSRQQQRRAKRRAEYLQNRNEELETSLEFGASKRGRVCCDEQNSDELQYELLRGKSSKRPIGIPKGYNIG